MHRYIHSYRNDGNWEFDRQTHGLPENAFADIYKLNDMGYKPVSSEFATLMMVIVENYEKMKQKRQYNPLYHKVWVRETGITYCSGRW